MATDISICNEALSNIGAHGTVTAIDPPDGSAYAHHCKLYYPKAVLIALESHQWDFAVKRFVLTQSADDGIIIPGNYRYAFNMPSDVVRKICVLPTTYVDEQKEQLEFEIEGPYLFCNEPNVQLKYIQNITNANFFTVSFSDCVTWKLSQYLAGVIVKGDATMRKWCGEMYIQALAHAQAINANSSRVTRVHTPPWLVR